MDDLRRDLHLPHRTSPAAPRGSRAGARTSRLGQTLAEARRDKQLELRDLAEITNIRTTHLEALEAGRHSELPEEVYSKNFVRLYAQAVGLDPARMLLLYSQERRSTVAPTPREAGPTDLELPAERAGGHFDDPRLRRLARALLTPLLVASTVLAGVWAFNRLLLAPPTVAAPIVGEPLSEPEATAPSTPAAPSAEPAAPGAPQTLTAASATVPSTPPSAADTMILLSLRTTPPGAEVSIDGYRFGQTPISDAPVRAGERTVTVTRGGYTTFERTFDLSRDRRLNIDLTPTGSARPAAVAGAARSPSAPEARTTAQPVRAAEDTTVTVEVTAEAWLEVYTGNARGEGERLIYETAQPGSRYTFEAPVYLFSGNAGGVSVTRGAASEDADTETLGAPGAVVGRAY
jgi:cytoskeleton protein RodZ